MDIFHFVFLLLEWVMITPVYSGIKLNPSLSFTSSKALTSACGHLFYFVLWTLFSNCGPTLSSPLIEPHHHWRNFQERAPLPWLASYQRKASFYKPWDWDQSILYNCFVGPRLRPTFFSFFFSERCGCCKSLSVGKEKDRLPSH